MKRHHSSVCPLGHLCLYSLWSFDQQLADEVHGQLRHPGEGVPAVVHVDLRHVQVRLLLVVPGEWRLARHQHVGYYTHTPGEWKQSQNTRLEQLFYSNDFSQQGSEKQREEKKYEVLQSCFETSCASLSHFVLLLD